jgi:hypothetical protein
MDARQKAELHAWARTIVDGNAAATEGTLWAAGKAILLLLDELEKHERESRAHLDDVLSLRARIAQQEAGFEPGPEEAKRRSRPSPYRPWRLWSDR